MAVRYLTLTGIKTLFRAALQTFSGGEGLVATRADGFVDPSFIIDAGLSGKYFIPAATTWLIILNFQAVVFGDLDIEGDLDVDGQLIMES